ncbi:MAG: radical SAM protein [Candidatus Aenigmarchaeota archaeon]|nr:radical SAM protein [Candidatus Aenigmarchaeota archaeon]
MEGIGEHVHWYVTGECNSKCVYCFGPHEVTDSSYEMEDVAHVLAGNAKKVILTGGEPLVKDLDRVLRILKQGGVYVSLHTNGILLDERKIEGLSGLVDDIAIPIDSTNRRTQRGLRDSNFMPVYDRLGSLAESIQKRGMGLGYHTVFTKLNRGDIPGIYKFVKGTGFDYWRIYEFNDDLARSKFIGMHSGHEISEQQIKEWKSISSLTDAGTPKKGYTDDLSADFLLTEREMKRHRDKRVQFVLPTDGTYIWVDNEGNATYYDGFSFSKRRQLGNIIDEGFPPVTERLKEIHEHGIANDGFCEEDFVNRMQDAALWARYYDGWCDAEELEEVSPRYHELLFDLVRLYGKRVQGIDINRRKL